MKALYILTALTLLILPAAGLGGAADYPETVVTVVSSPEQTEPGRPDCFPDPSANYIPLPETENFAEGKEVLAGKHNDVYVATNVNDGKTDTYWESKGFPAEITFVLGEEKEISSVAVLLNPSAIWEPRTQEFSVEISGDGESFTEIVPAAKYDFDAETGNRVRVDFAPVSAGWVKLIFTMNSSSRTGGAQAAEIQVY